ncbi:hypothetical protein KI387_010205 [Taxus chinensis]|uniref:Uncharacterized protein n=1 Tax=Taxus chinensis TaxID=29808 RepID=A0AA38FKR7_TAXCH|nr:hypothetical protein KI387_010205 [Taxus chinensis]
MNAAIEVEKRKKEEELAKLSWEHGYIVPKWIKKENPLVRTQRWEIKNAKDNENASQEGTFNVRETKKLADVPRKFWRKVGETSNKVKSEKDKEILEGIVEPLKHEINCFYDTGVKEKKILYENKVSEKQKTKVKDKAIQVDVFDAEILCDSKERCDGFLNEKLKILEEILYFPKMKNAGSNQIIDNSEEESNQERNSEGKLRVEEDFWPEYDPKDNVFVYESWEQLQGKISFFEHVIYGEEDQVYPKTNMGEICEWNETNESQEVKIMKEEVSATIIRADLNEKPIDKLENELKQERDKLIKE